MPWSNFSAANLVKCRSTTTKPIPRSSIDHDTTQRIIHGAADDVVPSDFSRNYAQQKKQGENVEYLEISTAGHFDLIDPHPHAAWPKV